MCRSPVLFISITVLGWTNSAAAQPALPLVEEVEFAKLRTHGERLVNALTKMKAPLPPEMIRRLQGLLAPSPKDPAAAVAEIQKILDPFCLVGVTINPESRVKAARGPAAAELRLNQETMMLVKVHNDAGVTHPLAVTGPQLRGGAIGQDGPWLDVGVAHVSSPKNVLHGDKLEYVVLHLTPREAGKREATLCFDVGQGTQDLGFRAEVPVLFTIVR